MSKIWFVTGSSRGLGRSFVEAALERGDKVAATARNTESLTDLAITYGGRLPPQGVDREAIAIQQDRAIDEIQIPIEPQYTYSNRSYWYPQAPVTDYATARLSLTVPGDLDIVASGALQGPPRMLESVAGQRPRKRYVFEASKPTRYLAVLISRFTTSLTTRLTLRDEDDPVALTVASNPRQTRQRWRSKACRPSSSPVRLRAADRAGTRSAGTRTFRS